MSEELPVLYLARHGETAWSRSGQHTGLTDLPLTEAGQRNADYLGRRLKGQRFARVFTSPLQRAADTCERAGFGAVAEIDPDLLEWNYGRYEGGPARRSTRSVPTGISSATAVPAASPPTEVGVRADRVVQQARAIDGDVLVFSSGHILRVVGGALAGARARRCAVTSFSARRA